MGPIVVGMKQQTTQGNAIKLGRCMQCGTYSLCTFCEACKSLPLWLRQDT